MIVSQLTNDEKQRLEALQNYKILDTAPEKEFDELVQLAAEICEVPISLISLVDLERQWFKAKVGIEADETHRDLAFCAHAIHDSDMLIVEDAREDERFLKNPLVKLDPKIRFYAGKPLVNPQGFKLGTLCAIDVVPRTLTSHQKKALEILSRQVVKLMELRLENLEHAQSIKELDHAKKDLQMFLDGSSDLIQSLDAQGNFKYVNKSWCKVLGYSYKEALDLNIFDIIHPSLHEHCKIQFAELLEQPESVIIDVIFKSKDGRDIVVEGNVNTVKLADSKVLTRGFFRDITVKRQAEKELKRTRKFLEQTNRIALVGGWEMDLKNNQLYWTEMTRRIHEVDDDFVPDVDKGIEYYKEGHSRDTIREAYNQAVASQECFDVELQIVTAKGNLKWVKAVGFPEFENGKCTRMYGTFQDIEKQKKNEAHLRLLESVVTNINDAIVVTTAEPFDEPGPHIVYANPAFCEMTGYEKEEVIGNSPRILQGPETDKSAIQQMRSAIEAWKPFDAELINYKKNGEKYWVNLSVVPLANEDGWFTHWISIERDVTQQKENEQKLIDAKAQAESASLAKSEFLANMSHEIRTPLNSVIGFSDLLIKTPLDENQRNYMQSVHQSANVLLDLINDILDFSKIEAGKLELTYEKTDLWNLVNQVVEIVKHKVDSEQVELLAHIDPDIPRFATLDPLRIRQILINLLGNAIKFTRSGEIELSVTLEKILEDTEGADLVFSVRDTGIGIHPDKQSAIFNAFSQEDGSTTRKYGGTGLGLAISNQLLKLMDTQLALESEQGKGSTFYFPLSIRCEDGSFQEEYSISDFKHVLVVDDHARNLEIVRQMLAIKDISCTTASNGIEALEELKTPSRYDLIIVDYHMPYMNGIQVIEQIRNSLYCTDIPIILLHSSEEDNVINQACKDFDIQKSINKPITVHKLFENMTNIQAPRIAERELASDNPSDEAIRLLIVDDNKMNQMVAKAMVEKVLPNGQITFADDGQSAIEIYKQEQPQMILMDVQMPGLSGYETAEQIRQVETPIPPVIIAFTAGTVKGERERCLDAGMNDYLSKPIVLERLQETLKNWIGPAKGNAVVGQPEEEVTSSESFDREAFASYYEKNEELMRLIMEEFVNQLGDFKDEIEQYISQGDLAQLKRTTHKLRGSASAAHMKNIVELTLAIEKQDPQDEQKLKADIDSLLVEMQHAQAISQGFL